MNWRTRRRLERCRKQLEIALRHVSRTLDDPEVTPAEERLFLSVAAGMAGRAVRGLDGPRIVADAPAAETEAIPPPPVEPEPVPEPELPLRRLLPSRTPEHRLRVVPEPQDKQGGQ